MAVQRNRSSSLEPLIPPLSSLNRRRAGNTRCSKWYKPNIIALLLWNMLSSAVFATMIYMAWISYLNSSSSSFFVQLGEYAVIGFLQFLYPICGLAADIYCGRYRVIISSIVLMSCGIFVFAIDVLYQGAIRQGRRQITGALTISIIAALVSILGFSGFKSNSVQFSLDQLQDASSDKISLFLLWFVWMECVGELVVKSVSSFAALCIEVDHSLYNYAAGGIVIVLSVTSLIFTCSVRNSFHHERISSNPYRNVWKVLKFAAKHSKPLGFRSAFTYSDHDHPSRIDLAKKKYGGPFETEDVEDVKTFLKIVVLLLAAAPVFFLDISTSYLFPIYGLHLGRPVTLHNTSCTYEWMLFESGNLSSIISVMAIPLYILILHPYVKKWIPRIITRFGIGIALMVAAVISMFAIQTVTSHRALQEQSINNTCLFLARDHRLTLHPTLQFPTQILVITNLLSGLGCPLIIIAVYEFISAQSPHTMKGLLLGVFYAFKGLFIILGSVATFPFAQESLWRDQHGMFDCGFYYYLSNSVFGVFGLVVFILAARWYRNRERDDPPYKYQYAEDYYSCNATQSSSR